MLNDMYSQSTSRLSGIEDILNGIGYLSEAEKEKEGKEKEEKSEKAGEDQEDKYPNKSGKKSRDYDEDGTVEDETDEYAGVKDKAIKKAMKKEDLDFSSVLDDFSDEDIVFLTDDLIEEMVEEALTECLAEGYEIEDLEMMLVESLDEAAKQLDLFQHQRQQQRKEKVAKIKGAVKNFASKVKSGAKAGVKAAASGAKKVAVKAAGAAGEIAGAARAGYAAGKAKASEKQQSSSSSSSGSSSSSSSSSSSDKPARPSFLSRVGAKLKSGIKKVVGKAARKVASGAGKVANRLGEETLVEKAPPSAKHERMVKHIKDKYKKGGLTKKEKGIAYATAWKAYNKEEVEHIEEDGEMQGGDKDPCWKGYQMVGKKMKGGKEVPNCVPKEEYQELYLDMIEEGFTVEQVREVLAAYEDGFEVIFEEDGVTIMEAQEARNNPEKYEADQKKKTSKSAMPPRGDKRREDFEKWYAANVR